VIDDGVIMPDSKSLVILGFGGHARSVANVALSLGFQKLLFVDENARDHETFLDFKVLKQMPDDVPNDWLFMPAAGDNYKRQLQLEYILTSERELATLVSQSAIIGVGAKLSPGCFVAHFSHVGPVASIGVGCIVNTGAVVEHECVLGDYSHASVNSTVAGRSNLGSRVFLGAGATVIDGISVAADVVVGAGAVVVDSIKSAGTYVGIPARVINKTVG